MPDETTTDETKKKENSVDLDTALDAIEKRVTAKLSEGFSSMDKRITERSAPPAEEENPWEASEDDEPITKKDFSSIVEKVAGEVTKRTEQSLEIKSKKAKRDWQARTDFPEIDESSPRYNKRFLDEVKREVDTRVQNGRKGDDADFIYDCTAAVAARGVRDGWYAPKAKAVADNFRRNTSDDSFDVRGSSSGSTEPTETQLKFASSMGLSKEKFTQHLKRIGQK